MKIIYFSDSHFSYMAIRSRLDNTVQTGLDKLQWILALAAANNINIVVCGGDFFNAHNQQVHFVNRLIMLIAAYREQGVQCYTVVGNHDVSGGLFENVRTSSLGVLTNTGLVKILGDLPLEDGTVIRGVSAYQRLDLMDSPKVSYLVVHGSVNEVIGDKPGIVDGYPVLGGMYYTSADLKKFYPNLKGILHGHIHHEMAVTKSLEGLWMVNPGSMLRCSSAEDSRRIPKIAYIDTETEAFQLHPIVIAQPYEAVFNLEAKLIRKDTAFEVSAFMSMITSSNYSGIDINKLIQTKLAALPKEDRGLIAADLVTQGFDVGDAA